MAYPVQADPTAVFGRRVLAALLDALLILVPVIMLFTAELEYHTAATLQANGQTGQEFCDAHSDYVACFDMTDVSGLEAVYFAKSVSAGSGLLYWGATIGLLVVVQGATGRTFGKLLTGIRTVREDGRAPGLGKAGLRWVLWIADGFPYFLPLVGFIVGVSTVGHRRVGDMVAKTFVVRSSAAGSPIVVPGLTAPPPPSDPTGGWGTPPPGPEGVTGWGQAIDPNAAGWASTAPPSATSAAPPSSPDPDVPHWDDARGTYIQWDPTAGVWMQWSETTKSWSAIPGQ